MWHFFSRLRPPSIEKCLVNAGFILANLVKDFSSCFEIVKVDASPSVLEVVYIRQSWYVEWNHTLVQLTALDKTPEPKGWFWDCSPTVRQESWLYKSTYTLAYAPRVCKNAYGCVLSITVNINPCSISREWCLNYFSEIATGLMQVCVNTQNANLCIVLSLLATIVCYYCSKWQYTL